MEKQLYKTKKEQIERGKNFIFNTNLENKMKKTNQRVISLVSILIIWLIFSGIRNEIAKPINREDFKVEANQRKDIIIKEKFNTNQEELRTDFIRGCSKEATDRACACMYSFVIRKVGFDSFVELSEDFVRYGLSNELAELIEKGADYCS